MKLTSIFLTLFLLISCSSSPPPPTWSAPDITPDIEGRWTDRQEENIWDFESNGQGTFIEKIDSKTYMDKRKFFDFHWNLSEGKLNIRFSKETVIIGNTIVRERDASNQLSIRLENDTFTYQGVIYFHVSSKPG